MTFFLLILFESCPQSLAVLVACRSEAHLWLPHLTTKPSESNRIFETKNIKPMKFPKDLSYPFLHPAISLSSAGCLAFLLPRTRPSPPSAPSMPTAPGLAPPPGATPLPRLRPLSLRPLVFILGYPVVLPGPVSADTFRSLFVRRTKTKDDRFHLLFDIRPCIRHFLRPSLSVRHSFRSLADRCLKP